uniref:Uncharacterized protein n=1 Tax=Bos mutus grunniens TaxID=30521 RepID=A0A8B9X0H0_BOSMU
MSLEDRIVSVHSHVTNPKHFCSLISSNIHDSIIAVVVFNITNINFFEATDKWVEDVRAERGNYIIIMLVGNKIDLNKRKDMTTTASGISSSVPMGRVSVQFSSVPQSCPTLCNPMDCSASGFPVHHQLPELAQNHVH